jgi:hypothetical protein
VTVPIEEYRKVPIYILEIKEICEKHDEAMIESNWHIEMYFEIVL